MGSSYFTDPLQFLISTLFSLYIMIVMLRFLFQLVRADFYNPISQFIVKVTNPLLKPLRRIIPGWGGIDIASIVLLIALQMISVVILLSIAGQPLNPWLLFVLSLRELVALIFDIYIYGIIIQAILSWVIQGGYNPAMSLLYSLTEPLLRPARNLIPPISGLDLSPLLVLLALYVARMLILPLFHLLL